ncbi:cellulose synthase [Nocardioides daphniae]|uniref:Cellulose synthase n=1 Tax=Nocardioides daphniae TaxID=402297 RepID=A0A4V1CWG1_9ACTN|nr:cellulose synthase [Nocardioides daphniae]QCC77147.1 cellulose synthase [Nocardioides daphniae]
MDDVTWAALALSLTVLGSLYSWWAFRHRGLAPGLRGVALTLLVVAAWLTGTLGLFTRIATAVSWWATNLVLSPAVWVGIGAAGTSGLLLVVARLLDRRRPGVERRRQDSLGHTGSAQVTARERRPRSKESHDDELDEIEELLRRRGIE